MTLLSMWNEWGERWFHFMGARMWESAIVLTAVSAVWALIRKKASPQLGYCLFSLVLIKLIFPIEIVLPAWISGYAPHPSLQRIAVRSGSYVPASNVSPESFVSPESETGKTPEPVVASPVMVEALEPTAEVFPPTKASISWNLPSISALLLLMWGAASCSLLARYLWKQ